MMFLIWLIAKHWMYYLFILIFSLLIPLLLPYLFQMNDMSAEKDIARKNFWKLVFRIFLTSSILATILILIFDYMITNGLTNFTILSVASITIFCLLRLNKISKK